MEDTKIARKYLKHIIKNAFGNHGLRKLKIIYVWDAIIYSNIYQIGGLFIRISVSIKECKASVLFYDYYGDNHSYLKNKTVTSIDSILHYKGKKFFSKYWNKEFKLFDRIYAIPYSKELLVNYYNFVKDVKNNLNYGKVEYYGDGYNNSRIEFRYSHAGITVVQGDCEITLDDLMTYNSSEIIGKVNNLRSLNLEGVSFRIAGKKIETE